MASRLHNFPLLTAEEIENTPSRQDGLSAAKEARLWKKIGAAIFETAKMVVPPMYVLSCFFFGGGRGRESSCYLDIRIKALSRRLLMFQN
jgi:hypothetical protein